jgi:hypothetical protein
LADIDGFASTLLEESKRFLELAKAAEGGADEAGRDAYLHATIMLAFCGLEAHVNAVADEMVFTKGLSVHERAILLERDVKLEDGKFRLKNNLKMYRLEDRILFLMARFSADPIENKAWQAALRSATTFRNQLTHPKDATIISVANAEAAILSVVETLDALYLSIYKKSFPAKIRGLHSKLAFG